MVTVDRLSHIEIITLGSGEEVEEDAEVAGCMGVDIKHKLVAYIEWKKVGVPFKILTGTPAGIRSLGRPRRIWKDNIRMNIKEMSINTWNWIDSAQDKDYWKAFVNAALNIWIQ